MVLMLASAEGDDDDEDKGQDAAQREQREDQVEQHFRAPADLVEAEGLRFFCAVGKCHGGFPP